MEADNVQKVGAGHRGSAVELKSALVEAIEKLQSTVPKQGGIYSGYEDLKRTVQRTDDRQLLIHMILEFKKIVEKEMGNNAWGDFERKIRDEFFQTTGETNVAGNHGIRSGRTDK